MTDDDDGVTARLIALLNRASVERSAAIARIAGSVLIIVGIIGMVMWLWLVVRTQDNANPSGMDFGFGEVDDDVPLSRRLDLFASTMSALLFSSAAIVLGMLARLLGDYTQSRIGGQRHRVPRGRRLPVLG
jgi:hypothetical protein